jgi:hypothetical protein
LADRGTAATLNEYNQGEMSSLLTLRDEGARAYEVGTDGRATEEIQLHKIDTIWDEITNGVESPRVFLKTDAQGLDTAIVLGAIDHLQYVHGIQSELRAVEIYEGMVPMAEALQLYVEARVHSHWLLSPGNTRRLWISTGVRRCFPAIPYRGR